MSHPPGEAIAAAAEQCFPGGALDSVEGRSWLVSVTTTAGRFSVRQLDPRVSAARVELLHEFLSQPELRNATPLVKAEGTGAFSYDARLWIAGTVAGAAIPGLEWNTLHLPGDVEASQLEEIADALGAFHRSGSTVSLVARAPRYRIKEGLTGVRRSIELYERALAGEIRKESRARRWLTASRPLLANAETSLDQVGFLRDEELVVAHLDLWGSHIVTQEEGGAAFLDCSTIAAAPAIVDIAQLIARNGAWSDDRVEMVLNRYAESYPIAPLQRRVLPWLTSLDAIESCGHLLVRAASERDPLSDSDRRAALRAADLQLELLQSLAAAFVPPPPRPYRRQPRGRTRNDK